MAECFADRLIESIISKGTPGIINIDPVIERLPERIACKRSESESSPSEALALLEDFSRRLIGIVAPLVPAVKINIAYFEPYHGSGVQAYYELVQYASDAGLIVIGDVKRGDVGHTATMYARAQLGGSGGPSAASAPTPDAVTVNGYFGWDGVKPFVDIAKAEGKGVFILVRTSNESAASIQDLTAADGRKVHETVASLVDGWAEASGTLGTCGFSSIGAVVATRNPADAAKLRAAMPRSILLVPGYGAQGGRAEDFLPYFNDDGVGALVAAGRSVIFAHESAKYRDRFGDDWERCVEEACRDFVSDLGRVVCVRKTRAAE